LAILIFNKRTLTMIIKIKTLCREYNKKDQFKKKWFKILTYIFVIAELLIIVEFE